MILRELIDTVDPSEELYIGSASAFVFIGTKAEYIKYIDRIDRDLQNRYKEVFERGMHGFARFTNARDRICNRYISKINMDTDYKEARELIEKASSEIFKVVKDDAMYALKNRERYKKYQPLSEREVASDTPRILGGRAIIVSGEESHNTFWLREECKRYLRKLDAEEANETLR